jgi:ankyrin repeat protein
VGRAVGRAARLALLAVVLLPLVLALGACDELPRPRLSLYRAVQAGDLEQLKLHIRWGTDLNQPDANGDSPLHVASRAGHVSSVRELAQNGADLNARDRAGRTPLNLALIQGKTQVAAVLVRAGAPLDPQAVLLELVAAGVSNRDSYDFLIRRGADPSRPDAQGRAPLHRAVALGHLETLRRLLALGAQVNQPDGAGRTPLDLALDPGASGATRGREVADIVKTLEQNGARRGPAQITGEQRQ